MWHDAIRYGLLRIFYPCLMIFGTIGNILCLKILLRKRFRHQSTCQYLCILAVIDILFIYMRSSRYLYRYIYNVDLRNTSIWICRTFIYLSSTLSHLASWILVIVSFDRYFIIINLFARRHAGSRVFKSTCILIFIVCSVNLHYFHILGKTKSQNFDFILLVKKFSSLLYLIGTNVVLRNPIIQTNNDSSNETYSDLIRFVCIARVPYKDFFRLYVPIFDLLFVAIIPFCLMMFTNIGIIRTAMRSNMLCTTCKKQQRNNRLTIMLLSVTLAFMLLTCPSVIYICLNRLTSSTTFTNTKLFLLDLLESLWYTKHALNFILYTLSGQDFRREFIELLSCSLRKTTSDTLNDQNRGLDIGTSGFAGNSPLVNKRLLEHRKERQNKEINDLSAMIFSKSLNVKTPVDIDGHFVVVTTYSSIQMATSITSDPGRSSSTTKTSVH